MPVSIRISQKHYNNNNNKQKQQKNKHNKPPYNIISYQYKLYYIISKTNTIHNIILLYYITKNNTAISQKHKHDHYKQ